MKRQHGLASLELTETRVHTDEYVVFTVAIESIADAPPTVIIDYVVHNMKANSQVFKLAKKPGNRWHTQRIQ